MYQFFTHVVEKHIQDHSPTHFLISVMGSWQAEALESVKNRIWKHYEKYI
jgi:hypothetical protein